MEWVGKNGEGMWPGRHVVVVVALVEEEDVEGGDYGG